MKGYTGNNRLLLSKYDYNTDLKYKSNLTEYSLNNYLREDICKKPKYMQSMFANSFINYNTRDKAIIQNNIHQKLNGILWIIYSILFV